MKYQLFSHRHGLSLLENEKEGFRPLWLEVAGVLDDIDDESLINRFEEKYANSKSISAAINDLIRDGLAELDWQCESCIFADEAYQVRGESRWRLDFAKQDISVEVAFNHGEAAAWNLLKPVLASELNHVRKAIQTRAGVVITATEAMKHAGGFDGAVGTYEKYVQYLTPLRNVLTVPLVIVGLEPPETFEIVHLSDGNKKIGNVQRLNKLDFAG